MDKSRQSLLTRPGEGPRIAIVGDVYRFLARGEDTDGHYALFEATVPPGGGPPPHIHSREEESFFVLEGEIVIRVDGQRIVATAGTFADMPIGSLHSFKNESGQTARMLISLVPAGLEKMFFEVAQPVNPDGTAPPPSAVEFERMLAVAPRYGIEIKIPST